jgi:hypothetical protein
VFCEHTPFKQTQGEETSSENEDDLSPSQNRKRSLEIVFLVKSGGKKEKIREAGLPTL